MNTCSVCSAELKDEAGVMICSVDASHAQAAPATDSATETPASEAPAPEATA